MVRFRIDRLSWRTVERQRLQEPEFDFESAPATSRALMFGGSAGVAVRCPGNRHHSNA